jgi:uncharacterized protein (TIGR02145 family)
MYKWFAVNDPRGLAPKGWHIPSDSEWNLLTTVLGGDVGAGTLMKSTSGWEGSGNGTNSSKFTGLPGGIRDWGGSFLFLGKMGYWWSSTEYTNDNNFAMARYLNNNNGEVSKIIRAKKKESGISVRCIKD